MQFVIIAKHAAELCPTGNAKVRQLLVEGVAGFGELAKKLGVDIITTNVFGPDHMIVAVVEAAEIEAVREFVWQSRLIQWNTTNIHATYSLEEAVAKVQTLPTIF